MQRGMVIVGIVTACTILAGTDYWTKERFRPTELPIDSFTEKQDADGLKMSTSTSASTSVNAEREPATITHNTSVPSGTHGSTSSNNRVVKKGSSTKKRSNVNVHTVFQSVGLVSQETKEVGILAQLTQPDLSRTVILLRNNDRAFLFSWIENDEVKEIMSALKKLLEDQFSPELTDLTDETMTSATGAPVDILRFYDPSISTEHIVFLRIRNRLYELHIAENGEEISDRLIEELSK